MEKSTKIPLFRRCVIQNFPFIEEDFDALTDYGLLCKVVEYLNKVIDQTNLNSEQVKAIQDWIETLDLQDEVDAKLDEMVEDGTLMELINPVLQSLTTVNYIFPKFWNGQGSSDCSLIKSPNKVSMFDASSASRYTYVKQMLIDNEIDHIDVLVISHYDGDHYGGVQSLIQDGYLDTDSIVYLPCIPDTYGQDYIDAANECKGWLDDANIPYQYPTEGQKVNIDSDADLEYQFANTTKSVIDNYSTKWTNNASMCCFIRQKDVYSFISGDAQYIVYKHLYEDLGYPKQPVSLYKLSHHGYEYETNINFVEQLHPKFGVLSMQGIEPVTEVGTCYTAECSILQNLGSELYACYDNDDYIVFNSNGFSMQCVKGKPSVINDSQVARTIYVDINASTSAIQKGTQSRPYSEICQALAAIPNSKDSYTVINVADGNYHYYNSAQPYQKRRLNVNGGKNCKITINGNSSHPENVVINGIYVHNSYVVLNNLTLDCDNFFGIEADESQIGLNNVTIKSVSDSETSHHGIVATQGSKIYNSGKVTIEGTDTPIVIRTGTSLTMGATFEIGTHRGSIITKEASCNLITKNYIQFDDYTDYYAYQYYYQDAPSSVQIMESYSGYSLTVNLLKSTATFDWIEIFYTDNDGRSGSTGRIYSPNGKVVTLNFTHYIPTSSRFDIKQCRATIGTDTITLDRGAQVSLTTNATTISANDNWFKITKVIAGYADYINLDGRVPEE